MRPFRQKAFSVTLSRLCVGPALISVRGVALFGVSPILQRMADDNSSTAEPPVQRPKKSMVYTRTGDRGTSALTSSERKPKTDSVFDGLGAVDELNSAIGVAKEQLIMQMERGGGGKASESVVPSSPSVFSEILEQFESIQQILLDLGSVIASPKPIGAFKNYSPTQWTANLEAQIDALDAALPKLTAFILPGGGLAAAHVHVCRSVCRRTERELFRLLAGEGTAVTRSAESMKMLEESVTFVNRLSDYFFVVARSVSNHEVRRRSATN